MFNGETISVAMASYNGEKFIREQLESICKQTVRPDEIVISDDGSKDNTLTIVKEIACSALGCGISFRLICDNPRKGYCGNFEWAVKHCSGDFIFLCDQDDIWLPQKIEVTMQVFITQPDASLVIHNASLVDANGLPLDGVFDDHLPSGLPDSSIYHISRESYLEKAVNDAGIRGMCMCFTSKLKTELLPFPKTVDNHDKWVCFCAIANDSCYYVESKLVKYRLHGNNTVGSQLTRGSQIQKLKRVFKNAVHHRYEFASYYTLGASFEEKLLELGLAEHQACISARQMREMGSSFRHIESLGRMRALFALVKLSFSSKRIRRTGYIPILEALIYVLYHGKRYRQQQLSIT